MFHDAIPFTYSVTSCQRSVADAPSSIKKSGMAEEWTATLGTLLSVCPLGSLFLGLGSSVVNLAEYDGPHKKDSKIDRNSTPHVWKAFVRCRCQFPTEC